MADRKDRKEKPVDKDDHMVENLGRCLFQEPRFEPYVNPYRQQVQDDEMTRDDPYEGGVM